MNLSDLVALAKAGYTPKQVKELIELADTSSSNGKAEPEKKKVEDTNTEPEPKKTENESKSEDKDPVQTLIDILKEEK